MFMAATSQCVRNAIQHCSEHLLLGVLDSTSCVLICDCWVQLWCNMDDKAELDFLRFSDQPF